MIRTLVCGQSGLRARTLALLLLSSAFLCAPISTAAAQTPRAAGDAMVSGTVTDSSGGVLPGVTVEAIVAGRTAAMTTTDDTGSYAIRVPQGTRYELRVRRDGFAEQTVTVAGAAGTVARDISMEIGTVSDAVVVTASRGPESRRRVMESVSVVTATDIAAMGSASLADVMRIVPGLHIEANGREGAVTSLFSRGGESDYNLVLVDGVRVNQSGGAFDFSRMAAGEIERVEIVRGAHSALYGSDAMGAVVQVFTRRAGPGDSPRLSGSIEAGSFAARRGDLRVAGGARQRLDYQAGVTHRGSNGAFADVLPEKDAFEQTAFDGTLGTTLGSRASLRTGLRYSDAQGRAVGPLAYGTGNTGTAYDTTDLAWHLDLAHTIGARVTGSATVAYFRSDTLSSDTVADPTFNVYAILRGTPGARFPNSPRLVRLIDRAAFELLSTSPSALGAGEFLAFTPFGVGDFPFTAETRFRRPAVKYQADMLWAGHRLSGGYEYERESNPLVPAFELDNHAFFVQQQFSAADRWFATVGGRVDDKPRYGAFFSPKLSIGGFLLPFTPGAVSSVKVFANVGKGIKNPQFTELFGSTFSDGNPDLRPERARTADIGAELTFAAERLRGTVTYFDNAYRDQVEFRSTGLGLDGLPDFINVAGSRARGWELDVALRRPLGRVMASGSYMFMDSQVTETVSTGVQFQPGQPLLRRPKHAGALRAAYMAGRATVNAHVRVVGERHDSSFLFLRTVPGPNMPAAVTTDITVNPGYVIAGLGVDFRARDTLTLFVRGDNVTNTAYENALGFPGLPRAVMAGARFTFGR